MPEQRDDGMFFNKKDYEEMQKLFSNMSKMFGVASKTSSDFYDNL